MEFVEKYTRVDDDDNNIFSDENVDDEEVVDDIGFIDDLYIEQSICNYQPIKNITKPKEVAMQEDINFGVFDEQSGPENYVFDYDEFKNFDKRTDGFKNDLYICEKNSADSFYFSILYWLRFELTGKRDFATDLRLSKMIFLLNYLRDWIY